MYRTNATPHLVRRIFVFATLLVCLKASSVRAQAVAIPQSTPVRSSAAPINVQLTSTNGGTIQSVEVFGQGSADVDFVNAGGGCTPGTTLLPGGSCNLSVVFAPASPGERRGAVVLLDSNRNTIASRLLVGQATGSVGVFVPGTISTVAGDTTWVYDGDGRPAVSSAIFLPFGIAVDAAGDLYIADSSNNRIRRVDAKTGLISTFAGDGTTGEGGDGGPATSAGLNNPTSVALDPAGNLFIADAGNNVIRRVDAFTGLISTVAGTLGRHGYAGDNGPATSATFTTPNSVSFDGNGNLYIADTGNHAIRMVNQSGTITTVAGTGTPGYNGDNQRATQAQLNSPWSATPISGGGFYVADQKNNRIRKVDASGTISTVAGSSAGFSGDNGPAAAASLFEPAGVLVDVAGNIYIADSGNNRVRRISPSTGIITTFAGNGTEGASGDLGPADQAGVYGPYAFALDSQGNLYIADVFHNRIRRVAANAAYLNYPVMRVNRISAPLTQTLENDGNAPLDVSGYAAVANSQEDAGTTTCVGGTPLASLGQCSIGVDFAPTATGSVVNGELDVDSDAGNSPGIIFLQGEVLNVNPTTIALSSSANPSVTGSTVIFTVAVASDGTTPTGNVNLLDGTTVIGTATLQPGGIGSFTLSSLKSGTHSLTASYLGDAENASMVSAVLTQVVKDPSAATTTSLISQQNPSIAGAPTGFTATVNVVVADSGNGNIGGTVAIKQGLNVLAVANIDPTTANGSTATANLTLTNLPVGSDSVVAIYSGNSSYGQSTSSPIVQVVQQATSHTVLSSAGSPAIAGAPLALTATLTSNGAIPTGNVLFMDGSTPLGPAPINPQGIATLNVPGRSWTVGTHVLTAVYAGDSDNGASNSQPLVEVINIASTSTALATSINPAGLGANVTFTATVVSTGGTPTGNVNFLDGQTVIGTGVLSNTSPATASFLTSALNLGAHAITAAYTGDSLDAPSSSSPLLETIQPTMVGVTLATSVNPVIFNAPLTVTAQVNGNGSVPSGTVSLLDGGNSVGTLPLPTTGIVSFSNPALAIGTHALTASYSGDINHASTLSPILLETVQQATTTTLNTSASTAVAGKAISFASVVTGVSGRAVSGTIAITDNGAPLVSMTPGANGSINFTTSTLTPGTHVLVATYGGDTLDAASTSASVSVAVTIATTTTSFATSANPIFSGSPLTLSAQVVGNGGAPTGSVSFLDGGTVLSAVQLAPNGTASLTLSSLAPGIHELSARYSGDPLDGGSLSPTISQKIAEKTSVTLTSSANPSLLQDNITLTVNVSNGTPSALPTGSVTITGDGTTLTTLMLNPNGTATFLWQGPALGPHTLIASYAGDNQNSPAASAPLVQTVNLRPSTVSFAPSANELSLGQQLTLVSVVRANGSVPPTGTVTWASGATVLGSAGVDGTGLASSTVTPPEGVFNVVAQYSGDSLYAPSVSSATNITVGPPIEFSISLAPPKIAMGSGSHGSIGINIVTAPTFTDTLALGCAGLPIDATCTFSENQIPVGNGVSHSLSVIVDTGAPLGIGSSAKLKSPDDSHDALACTLPAGALLALLLGLNRRKLRLQGKLLLLATVLLLGAGSTVLSGCGSSMTQVKTPAGSYTFQIVATGNKTASTQTATVQLTVGQ